MQTISFHQAHSRVSLHGWHAWLGRFSHLPEVNWYQVAVVAVTTFALAMDLMFPPSRMALANGHTVYAGHFFTPLTAPAAVQVDFGWLAVELLAIIAIAIVGWNLGTAAGRRAGDEDTAAY